MSGFITKAFRRLTLSLEVIVHCIVAALAQFAYKLLHLIIAAYAAGNKVVHQLIDLALLQNGMLKGAALDSFLKRSVDLIK